MLNYLYRNLRLIKMPAKQIVFNFGDEGDTFYIILEGEVLIRSPSPVVLESANLSPWRLLMFFV